MKNAVAPLGVSLLLASAGCVAADGSIDADLAQTEESIINGTLTPEGELPTVGGIYVTAVDESGAPRAEGAICTGTLISPTAVLTAAHCVDPRLLTAQLEAEEDQLRYFFTFEHDMASAGGAGHFLEVASVDPHADFLDIAIEDILNPEPGKWQDIAILYLADPVTDRPMQALAPPDSAAELLTIGSSVDVAGFGQTDDTNPMSAGKMHQGLSTLDAVGDWELKAGKMDMQQACRGDSGGPVFAKRGEALVQIGVASRLAPGELPAGGEPPGCEGGLLYTRVDAYDGWIRERVTDLPQPTMDADDDDELTDGGCGCSSQSAGGPGALLLALLTMVALRRRAS